MLSAILVELVQGQRFRRWSSTSCRVLPIHSGALAFPGHPWTNCAPKSSKTEWLTHGSLVPAESRHFKILHTCQCHDVSVFFKNIDVLDSEKAQREASYVHHFKQPSGPYLLRMGYIVSQAASWLFQDLIQLDSTLSLCLCSARIYSNMSCSTDSGLSVSLFLYITDAYYDDWNSLTSHLRDCKSVQSDKRCRIAKFGLLCWFSGIRRKALCLVCTLPSGQHPSFGL